MKDYTQYTDEELLQMQQQGESMIMDYLIEKYAKMSREYKKDRLAKRTKPCFCTLVRRVGKALKIGQKQ